MVIIHKSGTRKRAKARATLRPGTGVIRINSVRLDQYQPELCRQRVLEPLMIAGDTVSKVNSFIKPKRLSACRGCCKMLNFYLSVTPIRQMVDHMLRTSFITQDSKQECLLSFFCHVVSEKIVSLFTLSSYFFFFKNGTPFIIQSAAGLPLR